MMINKKDIIVCNWNGEDIKGVVSAVFKNIIRVRYKDLDGSKSFIRNGFINYNKFELINDINNSKYELIKNYTEEENKDKSLLDY